MVLSLGRWRRVGSCDCGWELGSDACSQGQVQRHDEPVRVGSVSVRAPEWRVSTGRQGRAGLFRVWVSGLRFQRVFGFVVSVVVEQLAACASVVLTCRHRAVCVVESGLEYGDGHWEHQVEFDDQPERRFWVFGADVGLWGVYEEWLGRLQDRLLDLEQHWRIQAQRSGWWGQGG